MCGCDVSSRGRMIEERCVVETCRRRVRGTEPGMGDCLCRKQGGLLMMRFNGMSVTLRNVYILRKEVGRRTESQTQVWYIGSVY